MHGAILRLVNLLLAALIATGCRSAPPVATAPPLAPAPRDVVYRHAAVAADHPVASEAGVEILRAGGNAVDAAVATSFALSVVRPYSCGLGGGGFMLIHRPGAEGGEPEQIALDYRETAPAAVGPDYYQRLRAGGADESVSRFGPHAVAVPGTVAGLLWALEHHGRLDRAAVLAPAIRAAEEGFAADANYVSAAEALGREYERRPALRRHGAYLWRHLCRSGSIRVGDTVTNPRQARALRLIAARGREAFYGGPIGSAVVRAVRAGGGALTEDDLAAYRLRVREPLRGRFRGLTVLSMPPPSSGGLAMQQVFALLERHPAALAGARSGDPGYVHLLAECFKHAFADRAEWLADADFVDVPVTDLLDETYLDEVADRIDPAVTRDRFAYGSAAPAPADGGTSHVSVLDADGMAVACTETINLEFGSLVAVDEYGFALNDEMDDFTTMPGEPNAFGLRQSDRNLPAPGKRPLSSMSPTIVLAGDRPVVIAGASGGPRIITGTIQCVLNCLLFDMPPAAAVGAPRFHHQWMPEVLQFEEAWADEAAMAALADRGHEVGRREHVGNVQLIRVTADGIRAASDPRKGGRASGY